MDPKALVIAFQCSVVIGLLGGLLLQSWEPIVVTIAAAATVLIANSLLRDTLADKSVVTAATPPSIVSAPTDVDIAKNDAMPDVNTRVPMYKEQDWDFVKPWWQMDITQQYIYRPTPERTIEPLGTRQEFVKYWARDSDAYAVKDRFCIPKGGTAVIEQRF